MAAHAVIHFQPSSVSFIFSFSLLPHKAIIAIKMKYLTMQQSECVRPYIANGHHGKAQRRENVADMERSAQSHLIQLRHFHRVHRPFFSARLRYFRFNRFYQLNWIRSAGPFFRVNIKKADGQIDASALRYICALARTLCFFIRNQAICMQSLMLFKIPHQHRAAE